MVWKNRGRSRKTTGLFSYVKEIRGKTSSVKKTGSKQSSFSLSRPWSFHPARRPPTVLLLAAGAGRHLVTAVRASTSRRRLSWIACFVRRRPRVLPFRPDQSLGVGRPSKQPQALMWTSLEPRRITMTPLPCRCSADLARTLSTRAPPYAVVSLFCRPCRNSVRLCSTKEKGTIIQIQCSTKGSGQNIEENISNQSIYAVRCYSIMILISRLQV
jgi:hypothetical protein